MIRDLSGLHLLVSGECAIEIARMGDELGAAAIQLREKDKVITQLLRSADTLRSTIKRAAFIINDRADIAKAVGADGVHLGQADLPIQYARQLLGDGAIIGVSTGSAQQAIEAQYAGANYVGFGHMYPTTSKLKDSAPRSLDELRAVANAVSIPVIAIGGITEHNAAPVIGVASGIAVIGAVQNADDPARVIQHFLTIIAHARKGAVAA